MSTPAPTIRTITTPSAIEKVTVPKPKRGEIIEAAAKREHTRLYLAYESSKAEEHNSKQLLLAKIADHIRKNADKYITPTALNIGYGSNAGAGSVFTAVSSIGLNKTLTNDELPKPLFDLVLAHHNKFKNMPGWPRYPEVLKQTKALFAERGSPVNQDRAARVNALLNDPESCKALDKMMAELRKPRQPALTGGAT